ncbi:MAG: hypothetical protein AB7F64_09675 [Gammaproteobacteria bacterium]
MKKELYNPVNQMILSKSQKKVAGGLFDHLKIIKRGEHYIVSIKPLEGELEKEKIKKNLEQYMTAIRSASGVEVKMSTNQQGFQLRFTTKED